MKKWIILTVFSGLVMVACNKSNVTETLDEQPATYTFVTKCSLNIDEETKSAYAGEKTFTWSDGDQISVLFHKEDENKFYTLTTTTGGSNTATFSGTIDAGWEVGASDGEHIKWALFPAGDHTYNPANTYPYFKLPAEFDYAATHSSANIPMYAKGDGENSFAFTHLCGAYKFTFTDLDVAKVKLIVTNQEDRGLSGTIPIKLSGDVIYLNYTTSGSSTSSSISFIESVPVSKTVSFYVPYQAWRTDFRPSLALVNMDEGVNKNNILLSVSASAAVSQTTTSQIVVFPSKSVPGTGTPFAFSSKFGIDWSNASLPSGTESDSGSKYQGMKVLKATADASYVYVYFQIEKSKLLLENTRKYANSINVYFGRELDAEGGDWKWEPLRKSKDKYLTWLLKWGDPNPSESNYKGTFWGDYLYGEYRIPRDKSGLEFLQTEDTAYVGLVCKYGKWHDGSAEKSEHSNYMFAPKTSEGYLVVSLPGYVAP